MLNFRNSEGKIKMTEMDSGELVIHEKVEEEVEEQPQDAKEGA